MKLLFVSARSATVLLDENGDYFLPSPVSLRLNGTDLGEEKRSVISLFDLRPDSEYTMTMLRDAAAEEISFRTEPESFMLDVRRFGAAGDGVTDDTPALQAAICCCPAGGRVLLPPGCYVSGPLFLKSHLTLELSKGAVLALSTDRSRFPILPGLTFPTGEG